MIRRFSKLLLLPVGLVFAGISTAVLNAADVATPFQKDVKPLLEKYCFDCHGDGMKKGDLALDAFMDEAAALKNRDKWQLVMRNVQTGEMPPEKKPQPSTAERELIVKWVEDTIF